jgi:hypothetical protein
VTNYNKKLSIYILLAIVIIGGISFFLLKKNTETTNTLMATSTPLESVSATVLQNDVNVQTKGYTKAVLKQANLSIGDVLITLQTGRAIIETQEGNETIIDYNSKLTITRHDNDGSHDSNFLAIGNVWARVKKVFGQGEFYEIETQNAVAVVRGTSFGLKYFKVDGKWQTLLEVSEGTVAFMPVDPKTRERIISKIVLVGAGKKAIIDDLGNVYVYDLTAGDKKDPWYIFNNPDSNSSTTVIAPKPTNATATTTGTTQSTTQISLTITSISPGTVAVPDRVYLKGSGFSKITTVVVGRYTVFSSNVSITGDTSLNFSTQGLSAGTFDVSVVDVSQRIATSPYPLILQDPAPTQNIYSTYGQ